MQESGTDHAEDRVRVTEARFRSLFEHSPVVLWEEDCSRLREHFAELRRMGVKDFATFFAEHPKEAAVCLARVEVLDVNQAAVRLYEARHKAELLTGLHRVIGPEAYPVFIGILVALSRGDTFFESEVVNQTFTGRKLHSLIRVLVAAGSETTWSRVYVSVVDLTAFKALEAQVRHAQKMEAIGLLVGGIAHDFRNAIAVIQAHAKMLLAGNMSDAEREEALRGIIGGAEAAKGLTRQLSTFSEKQVFRPHPLDLNGVVESVALLLRRALRHDIQLHVALYPSPLITRADPGMLDQVLMNLVVNARDAMPNGGDVLIQTAEIVLASDDVVRLPALRPGPHVRVSVTDQGTGISPDVMSHIFEPYFTTKEPGKGTGLGLATVFGIVKQHGGALRVTSEIGRGATFEVILPRVSETVSTSEQLG